MDGMFCLQTIISRS